MGIIRDSSTTFLNLPFVPSDAGHLTVGIIMGEIYDEKSKTFSYSVESIKNGRKFYMKCRQLTHFGDIFNYEEWAIRGFNPKAGTKARDPSYSSIPGEIVVVAAINGIDIDGVIVGYLKHPDRKSKRQAKEFAYYWSYNGVDISVDKDGAYKINFNGLPTNIAEMENSTDKVLPEPKYDTKIMGTFFTVSKDGSVEFGDGTEKPQSIKIDKTNEKITIVSGDISVSFNKKDNKIIALCEDIDITSKKTLKVKTDKANIEATSDIKIKSNKVAIGSSGVELLDSICKIVDELGMLIINSPNGPCQPFNTSPGWAKVESIKTQINSIKGSL